MSTKTIDLWAESEQGMEALKHALGKEFGKVSFSAVQPMAHVMHVANDGTSMNQLSPNFVTQEDIKSGRATYHSEMTVTSKEKLDQFEVVSMLRSAAKALPEDYKTREISDYDHRSITVQAATPAAA